MWFLPSPPPKDYNLKKCNQNLVSNQEFTPWSEPRITLPQFALYTTPIKYKQGEKIKDFPVIHPDPLILDRWTENQKAWWVEKPGINDYFIHKLHKKYDVIVDLDYNPTFKHKEKIFYRPYSYEFDCIESNRQEKILEKLRKAEAEKKFAIKKISKKLPIQQFRILPCHRTPPMWWKQNVEEPPKIEKEVEAVKPVGESDLNIYWQGEPKLVNYNYENDEPTRRRCDLALFRGFFRNEACNWYYKHHPPPNFTPIIKKN